MGCPPATFTNPNGPQCPIGYKTKPHQDCCGALIPCSTTIVISSLNDTVNNRFNTAVCGQGCSQTDFPPVGTTCFGVNERSSIWISFEIAPLPGQPYVLGAPAGKLRFKIIPCDVANSTINCGEVTRPICKCDSVNMQSPALCADLGIDNIGSTDIDWILFKTNDFRTRRNACNSINTNNSSVVCCSWSALRGPIGMFERPDGSIVSCDQGALGSRFGNPVPVFVGDKFMLALDNFSSGSLIGMKIDFSGTCANTVLNGPTAQLKIDTLPIVNFRSIEPEIEGATSRALNFGLNTDLNVSTFSLDELSLFKEISSDSTLSLTDSLIALVPTENPLQSSEYRLITGALSTGRYGLVMNKTTPSNCGYDRLSTDTIYFIVSKRFIRIDTVGNECLLDPIRLSIDSSLYRLVEWSTGAQTFAVNVFGAGRYIVYAQENSTNGAFVSDTITIQQRSLRNCPISITQNPRFDSLIASLPALRYQWELDNNLINPFSKRIPITANGSYRVRAINGRDTGIWSAPFVVTSNKLTAKSGGLEVFPNPSKGIVNIQVPASLQTIELTDKLGKVLLTKPIQNATSINVQGYPKGIYTIRAKGGGQALSTQLVVE